MDWNVFICILLNFFCGCILGFTLGYAYRDGKNG